MATNGDQGQARASQAETHPLYKERLADWVLMEDVYAGSRRVKERGEAYLPVTPGQRMDGMGPSDQGFRDYVAYKTRAIFHDVVKEAVQSMVGVMHRKDPQIKLPAKLEPLRKRATPDGEGLEALLRRINEQQLINARVGLLVEAPDGKPVNEATPFIATYTARSIVNWDTGTAGQGERAIEMVALDESAWERENMFQWRFVERTRVLLSDAGQIAAGDQSERVAQPGYVVAVLSGGKTIPSPEDLVQPQIGGRAMDQVPFVFVNANDLVPDPEAPPLLGLAELSLAIYRSDADYRQNLFMQGQATLVISGDEEAGANKKVRTGAGAIIDLPKGGDAKYVGAPAEGISAQERALDKLMQQAAERGAKLLDFDAGTGSTASGEALKVRVAARTTTLTSIAKTGAEGLEQALRLAAIWVGADPEEVEVEPNLQFADQAMGGQDFLYWTQAKNQGLPISWKSLHALMEQNDLTSMTYEDEVAAIGDEEPTAPPPQPGVIRGVSAPAPAARPTANGGTRGAVNGGNSNANG